ncbi:hypothetical protein T10_11879 [Trichinella papuae]|uniref:Uncharacterized protein n=1 Tax=Trichinella papuae TaxID=268474 RepID=A0A0V1LZC2_9BILA|nr:hypothetical protein T10_11879 [Trichinella papuae]
MKRHRNTYRVANLLNVNDNRRRRSEIINTDNWGNRQANLRRRACFPRREHTRMRRDIDGYSGYTRMTNALRTLSENLTRMMIRRILLEVSSKYTCQAALSWTTHIRTHCVDSTLTHQRAYSFFREQSAHVYSRVVLAHGQDLPYLVIFSGFQTQACFRQEFPSWAAVNV